MRAVVTDASSGVRGIRREDVPVPQPRSGQLLICVHAAGIAYSDLLMTSGRYQRRLAPSTVLGSELCGTVLSAPPSSRFAVGDLVASIGQAGGLAEYCAVDEDWTIAVPVGLEPVEGAGLSNYETMLYALDRITGTEPETALVLGASGGLGSAAVELLSMRGVRVVAVTRRPAHTDRLVDLGAGAVEIDVGAAPEPGSAARSAPDVDLVVDPVGGDRFDAALRRLRPRGTYLALGFAGGAIPEVRLNRLLLRNVSVTGAALGEAVAADPSVLAGLSVRVGELVEAGWRPRIERVVAGLDGAGEAFEWLERAQHVGKQVVDLRRDHSVGSCR